MRGEYYRVGVSQHSQRELPPRARRIPVFRVRNASTTGNYLRVRGEYEVLSPHRHYRRELPPRARRIPREIVSRCRIRGTTSACAENTAGKAGPRSAGGNYLRVRGEYTTKRQAWYLQAELPPRARRILVVAWAGVSVHGTTSACAENTLRLARTPTQARNYLRVRGEYAP